ncbi:MAG TPA: chemotaxis response regulator protein-glutamate methylesterase [Gemmatimonadaceae bacterium]
MSSERPTVLVVDDSAVVRSVITDVIEASGEFHVVGTAANGLEAIRQVHALNPALITLDVQMPELDGLQALGYIMSEAPRPVVMLSALEVPGGGDLTIRALELGAVDFVRKPGRDEGLDATALAAQLIVALRGAAGSNPRATAILAKPHAATKPARVATYPARHVVAIAASTGGPRALAELIPSLPPDLGAAVLVVQHMPRGFTDSLARRLDRLSALPVAEAREGDLVMAGRVYIAPGGRHMVVRDSAEGCRIALHDEPPVWGMRPSADPLFASVALVFGRNAVGVVLTGMGRDGAEGLKTLRMAGAFAVVQDPASSVVYGMPSFAIRHAGADAVTPLREMAGVVAGRVAELRRERPVTPASPALS